MIQQYRFKKFGSRFDNKRRYLYLPEKYVIESDLLADRHKHPTLFPIEMSEQECNERLEQIVKDSELVWEKK